MADGPKSSLQVEAVANPLHQIRVRVGGWLVWEGGQKSDAALHPIGIDRGADEKWEITPLSPY